MCMHLNRTHLIAFLEILNDFSAAVALPGIPGLHMATTGKLGGAASADRAMVLELKLNPATNY